MKKLLILSFAIVLFSLNLLGQVSHFPAFEAVDLNEKAISIPAEIYAPKTILIVPFKQKQQNDIYDFLAQIDTILANNNEVDFLEIPTISDWWNTFKLSNWIDNGMRSGIQDFETRKRTITRYIDVEEFLKTMEIPDKSEVCYYLIDKKGKIYWSLTGKANTTDIQSLTKAIKLID